MTIPIIPGPFSFLEEAGQAAGNYGAVKEERKRHAEQIAEHGSNFIMEQILKGGDPTVLDNPDVQKMMKAAYGFSFPSSVAKAIGAQSRYEASKTAASEAAGVPVAEAGAAAGAANLSQQTSRASMAAGVPTAKAGAEAAVAEAQRTGAQLNQNIFKGATALLGADPKFARLAYEAATGALDARLRYLEFSRANLTLERQRMADNARILIDAMKEGANQYDKAVKAWETGLQPYLLEHGDTPEARQAYADANPPPDQDKITGDYIKSTFGFDKAEYQRRLSTAMSVLSLPSTESSSNKTGGAPQTEGTTSTQPTMPGTNKSQQVIAALSSGNYSYDPATAGYKLAAAVQNEQLTDLEAAAIVAHLRSTAPGDWFKKFEARYKLGPKP